MDYLVCSGDRMKKAVGIFLVLVMMFTFAACSEETRIGYNTLSDRLGKINENYKFEYFDLFLYDETYHVTFSLCSEDDVMLSLHTDDNGAIEDLTVTAKADKMKTDGERNAFASFAAAVVSCYADLSEKEQKELTGKLSFGNPKRYFSDLYETYTAQRYRFIFSSNEKFISLYCEYYEIMEDPTLHENAR